MQRTLPRVNAFGITVLPVTAYPIGQLLVHDAHSRLVQWWIFTDLHTPEAMATRLVFGGTPNDPVVAVASPCDRAAVCAARKTETLQGPSIARSP